MNTKISVIIPVYKVEPYLRQCLDSVVNQTYKNLEIILIDDGSPDNCGKICDEYAEHDERIIVIHKKNEGLPAARNDGIKLATGQWITFVDSDDWIDIEYYERMSIFLGDNTVDIVCSQGHIIEAYPNSVILYAFEDPFLLENGNGKDFLINKILVPSTKGGFSISLGTVWDKFFRSAFIRQNNLLFDTSSKAWEDLWFSMQAFCKAQQVKGITKIGYHYRMVPNSITKRFDINRPQINYDFISKIHSLEVEQSRVVYNSINARSIQMINHSLRFCYFHPANIQRWKDVAKNIKEMKNWDYFHEAIWSNNNQYLHRKQIIFKWFLQLPWIWPIKVLYMLNEYFKDKECLNDNRGGAESLNELAFIALFDVCKPIVLQLQYEGRVA